MVKRSSRAKSKFKTTNSSGRNVDTLSIKNSNTNNFDFFLSINPSHATTAAVVVFNEPPNNTISYITDKITQKSSHVVDDYLLNTYLEANINDTHLEPMLTTSTTNKRKHMSTRNSNKKNIFKQYVDNTKALAITIDHETRGEEEETVQRSYEASSVWKFA